MDWTVNNEQINISGTESFLAGLPSNSKAASCYFGQAAWYWKKRNVPQFEKIHPDMQKKGFS